MQRIGKRLAAALGALIAMAATAADARACLEPGPVCAAEARVYAIGGGDWLASAVLVEAGVLATTRHVVADRPSAEVRLAGGGKLRATVRPTAWPGDLVLLDAPGLGEGMPAWPLAPLPGAGVALWTVAARAGGGVAAAPVERLLALPADGHPLSRIHVRGGGASAASGGALVDEEGRLVGVLASGRGPLNDAVPAAALAEVGAAGGPDAVAAHRRMADATIGCMAGLRTATRGRFMVHDDEMAELAQICRAAGHRQMIEEAARLHAQHRYLPEATELLREAVGQDPNAPTARRALAFVLHLQGDFKGAAATVAPLVAMLPDDAETLRLALQAAKWGEDAALAERVLAVYRARHPALAPEAEAFLASDEGPPS